MRSRSAYRASYRWPLCVRLPGLDLAYGVLLGAGQFYEGVLQRGAVRLAAKIGGRTLRHQASVVDDYDLIASAHALLRARGWRTPRTRPHRASAAEDPAATARWGHLSRWWVRPIGGSWARAGWRGRARSSCARLGKSRPCAGPQWPPGRGWQAPGSSARRGPRAASRAACRSTPSSRAR